MSDSVGSVSVEVVPDARGWSEKLRSQIRNQSVEVKANADTEEANAELDKTARTRTAKIKTDVSQFSQGASKLDQFVGNLGLLPSLAIAAGSALVPLGAALVGVTAAIGAPLAIAGGAGTLFGLLAGAAVAQTNKQLKVIDSLQKKLDGATKGTAAYAQAQKDLRDATKALTPEQTKYQSNISKLGAAFQNFLGGKAGGQLLSVVNQGIGLLIKLLPLANPLITAAGGAFTTLLDQLSRAAGSKGFSDFIHQLATQVGPDILTFAHIAGNGIKGVAGLLLGLSTAFGGPQGGVLHGLERLSAGFANLGAGAKHSQWLQNFVDYFHQVGPQVAGTLQSLGKAFGHIVAALAPLGPPVLHVIKGIADAFNSIPIPVLTGIAGAAAGLIAFQKLGGFKAASLIGKATGGPGGVVSNLLSGSVQKVYVVNLPPGGGLGGLLGRGGAHKAALEVGALEITASVASIAILGALTYHYEKPVLKDTAKNAISSWIQAHSGSNVGGSGPRTATSTPAFVYPGINYPNLNAGTGKATTALDSIRTAAATASRSLDMIGPHAAAASQVADRALSTVTAHLNAIHDQKFTIIADTAAAIKSLERIQALQIHDKSFTVYQRNQLIELGTGPGGGRHQATPGGSGSSTGRTPVHIHLDSTGQRTLTGFMDAHYQANAVADRHFGNLVAGR